MSKCKQITKHGGKRAHERVGITDKQLQKIFPRIKQHGIKHSETKGRLQSWMNSEYLKHRVANNSYYYAGHLYIMKNDVLITVLNSSPEIDNDLYNNTDSFKTFFSYKYHRASLKKDTETSMNKLIDEVNDLAIKEVSNYLDKTIEYDDYGFIPEGFVFNREGTGLRFKIRFIYKGNFEPLKKAIKKDLGLNAEFCKL